MPKFVFMPPQDDQKREFAARLSDTLSEFDVHSPKTDVEAFEMIKDADAAMGWIPPDALKVATKIRSLHNPDAGPFYGYYYEELCNHPMTITNPRGIYWDHDLESELAARCTSALIDMCLDGRIQPVVDTGYTFEDLPRALHALSTGETTGKLALTFSKGVTS